MHALAKIEGIKETDAGTSMIVTIPEKKLQTLFIDKKNTPNRDEI